MKNKKPVIIVLGEPNSVFTEILSNVLNKKSIISKAKYPIILIGSKKLVFSQLKILKKKIIFEEITDEVYLKKKLKNKLYLINIDYKFKKAFDVISSDSKKYISKCFEIALKFLDNKISDIVINGPISKKHFLQSKYPGITEYIFDKSKYKNSPRPVMMLFNKELTISPITTHIPLKNVSKKINQNIILSSILTINYFYRKYFKHKPKIAVLGLNPHCETKSNLNEENLIIKPAIDKLKKRKLKIFGPFPADTFFIKSNIRKYDSIVGMYHDQILTPFKTLYGFDASNITLGLPFLRMSVDHGPNHTMLGKNMSSTQSLENIFNFINSIK